MQRERERECITVAERERERERERVPTFAERERERERERARRFPCLTCRFHVGGSLFGPQRSAFNNSTDTRRLGKINNQPIIKRRERVLMGGICVGLGAGAKGWGWRVEGKGWWWWR